MAKYYFFCPNCKLEKEVDRLPRGTVPNIRDGYGVPINHYKCEKCANLDAGFMRERACDRDEKQYYKDIISLYQGIRGFDIT